MSIGSDFKARCLRWSQPVGPFTTEQEDLEAKELYARRLSADGLRDCMAEAAKWAGDKDFEDLAVSAFDFAWILKLVGRGREMGQTIIDMLTPSGPPLLVSMWGEARQQNQTAALLGKLDVNNASADLQVALAGALLSVEGTLARDTLRVMKGQARSPEAQQEIDLALSFLDPLVS